MSLYPPLPQKTTQTFWVNASKKFEPSADGIIRVKGSIKIPSFALQIGMYRVTKLHFSGNWPTELYRQNSIFERVYTSLGDSEKATNQINIYSEKTKRQLLSHPLASETYFELDWTDYFEITQTGDSLVFSIDQLLTYDENEIQFGFFRPILGIQLQRCTDSRWIEAIQLGKI